VSMRILVVDEDPFLKDLLGRMLASDTCEVFKAASITGAKTTIVDLSPSLVIVDAHLPDASPFIFTLRSAKTPVIALVRTDQRRDQLRLAEIPAVDRRGSLASLVDTVRSVLDREVCAGVGGTHHVLVVDDEDEIRAVFSDFLTQAGYTTSAARDGIEAIRILDRNPDIAVVLLDVAMPRSGGLETLSRIMARPSHPGVIMLSALADTAIVQRAVKLGAFGYILKPPDFSELEATVSAYIACTEMAS
jgi:DNA-binding response OmpR family regulator